MPHPIHKCINTLCGPGSSVGIATDYGLDGPGSNPDGDEIFVNMPHRIHKCTNTLYDYVIINY